jgi:hypothetical protein
VRGAADNRRRWGVERAFHPLTGLLAAALAVGFLRILIVPDFLNYDEPAHFRAIMVLLTQIRACMAGACTGLGAELQPGGSGPFQGYLYYLPQAIIQGLLPNSSSFSLRVAVARLFTLSLQAFVILLTYKTMRVAFPERRLLALAAAGFAALMPSFSDMMSGVNLDAPAALLGGVIIYGSVRLTRFGVTARRVLILAALLGLGYFLKGTVWPLVFVVVFALGLSLPGRVRLVMVGVSVLAGTAVIIVAGILLKPVSWDYAAYWFRVRKDPFLITTSLPQQSKAGAVEGLNGILVLPEPRVGSLVQYLPDNTVPALRGHTLTYGVWVRAVEGEAVISVPLVSSKDLKSSQALRVPGDWQFYAAQMQVDPAAEHLAIYLARPAGGAVFYDGLVVADGDYDLGSTPEFAAEALTGDWGGQPFANLALNPSFETQWPQVLPEYDLIYSLNDRLVSVLYWERTWYAWLALGRWWVVNLWSSFGGVMPGLGRWEIMPFGLLTAAIAVGLCVVAVRSLGGTYGTTTHNQNLWVLIVAAMVTLGIVIFRTDISPYKEPPLIWSSLRHASAGRVAWSGLLALGLMDWIPSRYQSWATAAILAVLFLLNIYILFQVQYPYQFCPLPVALDCLSTIK